MSDRKRRRADERRRAKAERRPLSAATPPPRCDVAHPERGVRCEHLAGHGGPHVNASGTLAWPTPEAPRPAAPARRRPALPPHLAGLFALSLGGIVASPRGRP